jgi:hypothetical protein
MGRRWNERRLKAGKKEMRRKTEKNSSLLARFLVFFIARPREISLLRRESNAIKGEAEILSSAGKTSRKTFPHC